MRFTPSTNYNQFLPCPGLNYSRYGIIHCERLGYQLCQRPLKMASTVYETELAAARPRWRATKPHRGFPGFPAFIAPSNCLKTARYINPLCEVCAGAKLGGEKNCYRSLNTRGFEMRTATGSELFSLLTCPHTTTFALLSIFSLLEMSSIKIWVTTGS